MHLKGYHKFLVSTVTENSYNSGFTFKVRKRMDKNIN